MVYFMIGMVIGELLVISLYLSGIKDELVRIRKQGMRK